MGRISNWLTGIFAKTTLLQTSLVEIPLSTLHSVVSHIPLEASRNFDSKDAAAERWLKLSGLMTDVPHILPEHVKNINQVGHILYDIGMDILGSQNDTVNIPEESLRFIEKNQALFIVANRGYKRSEQENLKNVYSLFGHYRTSSSLLAECPKRLKEMMDDVLPQPAAEKTKPKQKPAVMFRAGMPGR